MSQEKQLPVEKIVVSRETVERVAKGLSDNAKGKK
jgi:hypothetical protein